MRPVDDQFPKSQDFGSYATAGVTADPNGTEVQQLVAAYGNYQPYGHAGQDIACPIGTPVHAIAAGTVIWADWGTNLPGDDSDAGYRQRWYLYKNFPGIITLIQHDGWISGYGHLSSNDAAPVGTVVDDGQLIALSGNTKAPGVTLGAHLHVMALVDLSYSTGNGLIYGCADPEPYYNTGISPQGTITPVQEDDMALSLEDKLFIQNEMERRHLVTRDEVVRRITTDAIDGVAGDRINLHQFLAEYRSHILQITGGTANVPNAVLNAQFTLPDGTITNLAGILAAIHAKPATVTNVTSAPSAVDVDALVARLKAELPAAVLAQLATQLTKP